MPVTFIAPQAPSHAIIVVDVSWLPSSLFFMLDVEDSVYCLQILIEQELGHPMQLQELFLDSMQLRGSTLLKHIYEGSVIFLQLKLQSVASTAACSRLAMSAAPGHFTEATLAKKQ